MIVVVQPVRFGRVPAHRLAVSCERCGQDCWHRARFHPDAVALCVVCAMAVVRPGHTIHGVPWKLEELVG